MRRLAAVIAVIIFAVVVALGVAVYRPAASPMPLPPHVGGTSTSIWDLPHHPSDRTALLAQLDAAERYWHAVTPPDYELTVSLHCFCNGLPLFI